ncbi:MAG: glycosyl transferase family 1 [Candidatus Melainabacteria bacterium RIFOXYA12_FULL_32_12]|nr:MAG: glycosyl transferase family 1 [Candidatus Melainabacteria bacterium RIFOXYA2_FULL_32_9]OGI25539.1 MAG: glycosyl transferase family 1 [Candidatus Melainabacteria bacterium RIFOXYA12_FULL_32_12]
MRILFLHRNFPAQFKHLINYFTQNPDNQVVFITGRKEDSLPGVTKLAYNLSRKVPDNAHRYLRFFEESILHGQASAQAALSLKNQGFIPDIIIGHSWGNTLFIKDVFPDTPVLCYLEWFYRAYGSDVDFEKQGPLPVNLEALLRVKNSHILIDLYSCDHGISPTKWQHSQFPPEYHDKISIIHDGINTDHLKPDPEAKLVIPHLNLDLSEVKEIITYVSRGLEPYRGFHKFMEAVPHILERRPNAHIVIVGEDRVYYGSSLPNNKTYKQEMLEKISFDTSRVHFTGRISYDIYLKVLQASSAHIYLTYPFVLSWSMLEAMSAGCLVIGSNTPPVTEVIKDGENGLLVDFFSPQEIAERIDEVLNHPDQMKEIRIKARETILEQYDLKKLLPKQIELINDLTENSKLSMKNKSYT